MAASRTIEARLVISGEGGDRVSAEIAKVTKAIKDTEAASRVSNEVLKFGRAFEQVSRQARAAQDVLAARGPLEATVKNMQRVQAESTRLARDLDVARKAADEFAKTQRAVKSIESATQMAEMTRKVRDLGTAHRAAEREASALARAFDVETRALRATEDAASRLGVDLSRVEQQQRALARSTQLAAVAFERQAVAEERASHRRAQRREAVGTIAAGAGVLAAHKGKEIGIAAIDQAASFDYAKRYQVKAGGVTEEQQKKYLLTQALRIGQETKFSNEDIVEAQTATLQGLPMKGDLKASVAAAIVENVKNYAVMMRAPMEASAQGIRSFLQTSQKDISTEEKAVFEAKRASNLLVKMAKLGGMKDNDVQDFLTYGVPTGTSAGLSDTTLAALGAAGKRSGLGGSETGVFVRAAASKLVAPTRGGLDALTAAGIDYNKFTKMPGGLSVDNLEAFSKRRFGKGFSADQRGRLADLLEDGDVIGDRAEFTKQVSEVVQEGFAKNKKGKTSAQDARNIAKMLGDFQKLSVESVDSEGLLDAILSSPKMTQALRNAFFTDKHGGKASVLSSQFDQFKKDREELRDLQTKDPNFAADAAKYMAGGLGGTIDNLKGSYETLILKIGEANSGLIKFAAEGLANGTDMFSNLSQTSQQVVSLVGGGAAAAGGVYGAAKLTGKLLGFGGGGAALNGSAAALTKSAALLDAAAIKLAGGVPGGVDAKDAAKAAPLAALGLTGVTLGTVAGAAFAGYATAKILPKIAEKEGPGAIDPATGEKIETEIPKTTPWLRNWLTGKAAEDAGKAIGAEVGKGIVAVPLPPPRPDAFRPITERAGEAGTQAGQKVGQGVADGVQEKAPEVEAQGKTLWQRLKDAMANPIFVPISFAPGQGFGGGGGGGGGLIQRASFGGGGSGGGIDSGGGGSAGLGGGTGRIVPRGKFGPGTGAGDSWYEAIMRAEGTAGKDPYNVVLGNGRYGLPSKPLTDMTLAEAYRFGRTVRARHGSSSAIGAFQIVGQTMKTFMGEAGLGWDDKFSPENQRKLADVIRRRQGFGAWEGFKVHPGELGNARRLGAYKSTPGEPRLVKGADGKEGLDLGNGTMRMPDGSIRPVPTKAGLSIPDAPAGGFGGGRGGINAAADKIQAAAEMIQGSGFHGQISLAITGSARDRARVTGLRMKNRGAVSADMGVSMPGAKESDDDWA